MKIAYGDLIGGVSGDMFVAALLDLGLPLSKLATELRKVPTLKFELKATKKVVHSVRAKQLHVICAENEPSRSWKQIRDLITRSRLDPETKRIGTEIFTCLAEAEAKIHGVAVDKVHFHELLKGAARVPRIEDRGGRIEDGGSRIAILNPLSSILDSLHHSRRVSLPLVSIRTISDLNGLSSNVSLSQFTTSGRERGLRMEWRSPSNT